MYGSETWAVTEMGMKGLGTWDRKILRRIHRPEVKQGICRTRINQELRELHKDVDIVAGIRKKRLEWIGHVVRMNQGRTVKKISESKLERTRRKERPRQRWLEDVEKNLQETKVKRWRQKAVDREE